jgi:hypothetical protein
VRLFSGRPRLPERLPSPPGFRHPAAGFGEPMFDIAMPQGKENMTLRKVKIEQTTGVF